MQYITSSEYKHLSIVLFRLKSFNRPPLSQLHGLIKKGDNNMCCTRQFNSLLFEDICKFTVASCAVTCTIKAFHYKYSSSRKLE